MRYRQTMLRRLPAVVVVGFAFFMLTALWGDAAHAAGSWEGDQSPTMKDLIPDLGSGEAYSERYTFSTGLKGGGSVSIKFTVSNLGWGDAQGATEVRVKLPNRDNYTYKKTLKRSEWSFGKDSFRLKMGNTSVKATSKNTFELSHSGEMGVEMTMTSKTPMWSPGELKKDDQYFRLDFYALKADVDGRLKYDGSWHDFQGDQSGYGEHAATNIAPYTLAKRFSKSRVYDSESGVFFIWREIKLTKEFGGHSAGFLLAGYKQKIVLTDNNPEVKFGKVKSDPKTGYRVPRAIQVEAKENGNWVKLVLRGEDMTRKDLLDRYGKMARMVASSMTEPYNYYFDMKWGLNMKIDGAKASVRGDGGYVIDWLNK